MVEEALGGAPCEGRGVGVRDGVRERVRGGVPLGGGVPEGLSEGVSLLLAPSVTGGVAVGL